MKTRPLGKLSDFVVEQMSVLLMEESETPNVDAMMVFGLIDRLPKELVNQVCADPSLCNVASLDLKMIEQAIAHTRSIVPPKSLLALVNKISGAAKSMPMLSYEELVLVNPKEDLRTFTHGRVGEVEKKFYLSHYAIERHLGSVLAQLHRVRNYNGLRKLDRCHRWIFGGIMEQKHEENIYPKTESRRCVGHHKGRSAH